MSAPTQLSSALGGVTTPEMRKVAKYERLGAEALREGVASGLVVIPANPGHEGCRPVGIGRGLSTKVNANMGTSTDRHDASEELGKVGTAIEAGADAVMDLSTGGDLDSMRRSVLKSSRVPVGTVPIYQAVIESGGPGKMDIDSYLDVFSRNARDGIDFATVHAGVTRAAVPMLKSRLLGVVSRGGAFLVRWMKENGKENPLYDHFDEILGIARKHDVTLSLGDGLRPGCIKDATDRAQIHELKVLGKLARRCRDAGVQVMIEGPGHVPLQQIERNMKLEKKHCDGAPFYVLGPLPTDSGAGHDHLVSAIGGALAAMHGADFLCYVTPKEHIGLPDAEEVREGVIASKIAAHIGDIAKGYAPAVRRDELMSRARAGFDWDSMLKHAIDPEKLRELMSSESKGDQCSMCGQYCAMKVYGKKKRR